MGEVLSQSEIDNLLQALSSGELDVEEIKESGEKQVKNYDFARPAKFSKEHLRTLEIIFEHYGRLLATNLTVYLRKNIQVEVMNSEAVNIVDKANVPDTEFASPVKKYAVIACLMGCLLVILIIVIRCLLDDTIKTSEDVEKYLGLSTLTTIPVSKQENETNKKFTGPGGK